MEKIVLAYVFGERPFSVDEIAGDLLTHINYAFVVIEDGKIVHKFDPKNFEVLQEAKKRYPHLKLMVSVGGWEADGFSDAALTKEARARFVDSVITFVKEYKFDGVDLDWEYPCNDVAGIKARPEDRENFTLMLRDLREALNKLEDGTQKYYPLTIAAGGGQSYIDGVQLKEIEPYLDFINIMTYDFFNGLNKVAGHHTNLHPPKYNPENSSVEQSVKLFSENGIPLRKITIGAAFYGRGLRSVKATGQEVLNSIGEENFSVNYSTLVEDYIEKNGYTRYWDDSAKAPYLFNGTDFITYDDEKSTLLKGQYVTDQQLGGAFFWENGLDSTGALLKSLVKGMNTKE